MILDQNATITVKSAIMRTVFPKIKEVNGGIEGSSFIIYKVLYLTQS
jgi:hypothetical protein